MMDAFHPRRRLLFRRLWRARVKVKDAGVLDGEGEVEAVRQQKAFVRLLTRTLTSSQLDALARLLERSDDRVCVPVTAANELSIAGSETTCDGERRAVTQLVDGCCELWRPGWAAARSASVPADREDRQGRGCADVTLRRLMSICPCDTPAAAICLNPFHWTVDVTSQPCHISRDHHAVTERDVDAVTASEQPWCRVVYHEYRDHVGTPGSALPVHSTAVNVFSQLHHASDGLCLSAVRSSHLTAPSSTLPPWKTRSSDQTLARVGRGVTLSLERASKSVWLYNRSEVAVFALSPTTSRVLKLLPAQSARVYTWGTDPDDDDRKTARIESSSPGQFDCILVSFVKGWSGRYKRQSILSCPCWLEVILARTLDGVWDVDNASEII